MLSSLVTLLLSVGSENRGQWLRDISSVPAPFYLAASPMAH